MKPNETARKGTKKRSSLETLGKKWDGLETTHSTGCLEPAEEISHYTGGLKTTPRNIKKIKKRFLIDYDTLREMFRNYPRYVELGSIQVL